MMLGGGLRSRCSVCAARFITLQEDGLCVFLGGWVASSPDLLILLPTCWWGDFFRGGCWNPSWWNRRRCPKAVLLEGLLAFRLVGVRTEYRCARGLVLPTHIYESRDIQSPELGQCTTFDFDAANLALEGLQQSGEEIPSPLCPFDDDWGYRLHGECDAVV